MINSQKVKSVTLDLAKELRPVETEEMPGVIGLFV